MHGLWLKILFLSLVVVCTTMPCIVSASDGRLLDVYTQKGGTGPGSPGGIFNLLEIVDLTANLTYNGYPVQHKDVAFMVTNPKGETFIGSATTDQGGLATMHFRIRISPECLGTWTVVATADIACVVVSDSLTFEAKYFSPPHGPEANFTEDKEIMKPFEEVEFDASDSAPGWDGIHILFPITEYRWDFGDGNKTVTNTPVVHHAYNQSGIYYVTLVVYAPGANPETSTSSPQEKVVIVPPVVGGYSLPMAESNEGKPLASYITLLAICMVSLAAIRRKPAKEAHVGDD